jgi:adenylate cyclase
LRVHELRGAGPLRTRFDVSRARGLSRFVGRVEELAGLDAALERARQGSGPVVGVVAEAGVGKSRLCFEFAERCRARGIPVLEAHAVAHGKQIPLLPMLELFRTFFGILESDSDRSAREKIAGRLMLLDEELREELPLVFDLLGVPDAERPLPEMEADVRQHRVFTVVKRIVRASAQRETAVTLVEDLHWMDAASDALLEQMAEAMEGTRGLLLVNFRPEYHARWMQRSSYQQLPLVPLGPEAIRELLGDLLGEDPSVGCLPELIRERTGGNPFFIEEVVRTLVEGGHLEGRAGAYRLATPVEDISVPATVQAVLAARIDRLAEREKRVLQTASVIGKTFSERMLQRLCELPDSDLSAALSALRDAEFLYEESLYPEVEYAFRHPLTQEVAYGSQLRERRVRIHAAVARAIEELEPEKLGERAALIAHHWEAAGEGLEAARWNRRAARWAGSTNPGESLRHWRKVESLLRDADETDESAELALEACRWILRLAIELGADPEDAAAVFERGSALAEARGDLRSRIALRATYATVLSMTTGDIIPWLECARGAAVLAEHYPEPIPWVESGLADALNISGDLRGARGVTRRYLERALTPPEDHLATAFHFRLMAQDAFYTVQGGRPAEGIERLERLTQEQRARRPQSSDFAPHLYIVLSQEIAGDVEAALAHARECLVLAERTGTPLALLYGHFVVGVAHVLRDAMPEAVRSLDRALRLLRGSRIALRQEPAILLWLAQAQAGVGEVAQARETAQQSIDLSRQGHSRLWEMHGFLALARVLLRSEDPREHEVIEKALNAAADLVEADGTLAFRPFIHVERVKLARQRGDEATRERELRRAQQLFSEMGAPIRAAEIARELES